MIRWTHGAAHAATRAAVRGLSTRAAKELPSSAEVVIIGGGSLGGSTFYHLAKMGVDVVLVEKNRLTSGTTWHSAGLLWHIYGSTDTDIELIQYGKHLFQDVIGAETGLDSGWINNGGLFACTTKERFEHHRRVAYLAQMYGTETHFLTPEEAKGVHPLMNTDDLYGAIYSPGDGTIDPDSIVNCYVKGGKMAGGRAFEMTGVTGISTRDGAVTGVTTTGGHIETKKVVNCCGSWSQMVGDLAGVNVPLMTQKHAYVVTEKIPGIQGLPNVRDFNAAVYMKLQGDALAIGGYEENPIAWEPQEDFAFGLFDLDWDTFNPHIEAHINRIPAIAESGIKSTVCGPESFTADHKPLMGEHPRLQGFYLGCGFNSAGMMFGAGCGRELAKWIRNGRPDLDMFSYDIRRFHDSYTNNKRWLTERCHETYANQSIVPWTHDEPQAGRNLRKSPIHDDLLEDGCIFGERHGWEKPNYFARPFNGRADVEVRDYDFYGYYGHTKHSDYGYLKHLSDHYCFEYPKSHDVIAAEALGCRDSVAVFEQSSFGKLFVEGSDAAALLGWACTANVNKAPGATTYTAMCNDAGGTEADFTVSCIEPSKQGEPRFYITTGGASCQHNISHLETIARSMGLKDVSIRDESEQHAVLSVMGRHSLPILQSLSDDDWSLDAFKFSTNRTVTVAGHRLRALRLTFVGELGWELHIPNESAPAVYRAIMEAGRQYDIRNAGYYAINSLSAEKGYRHWHADLRADDTPLEAGIGFVAPLKSDKKFLGREALERQKAEGLKKRLGCFVMEDPSIPLWGMEVLYRNGVPCGHIRSAAYGFSVGSSIGYGYVRHAEEAGGVVTPDYMREGDWEVKIGHGDGGRHRVRFSPKAPFDPSNERVKGIYE